MILKCGVQGGKGSACHVSLREFLRAKGYAWEMELLMDAQKTVDALKNGVIDRAWLAIESPRGKPLQETLLALKTLPSYQIVDTVYRNVDHVILGRKDRDLASSREVYGTEFAIKKHEGNLSSWEMLTVEDIGNLAEALSNASPIDNISYLVIAPRGAHEDFPELKIMVDHLSGNIGYETRFDLVRLEQEKGQP